MKKLWIISDTHFFHKNILKYENRPFNDVEEMNQKLIENWNSVVAPDDIVIHCGDFSLGSKNKSGSIMEQLNGYKILILGNHDFFSNEFIMEHGFSMVEKGYLYAKVNGKKIMFSHRPIKKELIQDGIEYYFGHVHSNLAPIEGLDNTHCICVERINYKPFLLEEDLKSIVFFPHNLSPKFEYDEEFEGKRHEN